MPGTNQIIGKLLRSLPIMSSPVRLRLNKSQKKVLTLGLPTSPVSILDLYAMHDITFNPEPIKSSQKVKKPDPPPKPVSRYEILTMNQYRKETRREQKKKEESC